jgi:hypothetical protein
MTPSRTIPLLAALLIILCSIAFYISHKTVQAPSPPGTTETAPITDPNWQTYSDRSISFRYPAELPTTYIHPAEWPPTAGSNLWNLDCVVGTADGGMTRQGVVNGHTFCVTVQSDGAAGSIYNGYDYGFQEGSNVIAVSFTLRMVQCGNYDEPEKTACEQERDSFNVDDLADRIAQTVELK